jgi:integrase
MKSINSLTYLGGMDTISSLSELGISMKGIYPTGKCYLCGRSFTWKQKAERYECPNCKTRPESYHVKVSFKGKRITRGTTLEGQTLRSVADAYALVKRAKDQIVAGKFDPEIWTRKDPGIYHPGRLYARWYRSKLRDRLKPGYTVKLKSYYRVHFRPYCVRHDITDIRDIRTTQLFFDECPGLSAKYRKNIRMALSSFFRYCKMNMRVIEEIPFFPKLKKPAKYIPQVLDIETRLHIIDTYVMPEHRPILGFYAVHGCRPGEAIALKGDRLKADAEGRYVEYTRTVSDGILQETTKDGEGRAVPIFRAAEKYLPASVLPGSFVFTNRGKMYTLSVLEHQLMNAFKRYNKAMTAEAEKQGKEWAPIRIKLYEFGKYSRNSEMYEAGVSLADLQKYNGHSRPEETLLYNKIDVLKRFRKLDNVVEFKKAANDLSTETVNELSIKPENEK